MVLKVGVTRVVVFLLILYVDFLLYPFFVFVY